MLIIVQKDAVLPNPEWWEEQFDFCPTFFLLNRQIHEKRQRLRQDGTWVRQNIDYKTAALSTMLLHDLLLGNFCYQKTEVSCQFQHIQISEQTNNLCNNSSTCQQNNSSYKIYWGRLSKGYGRSVSLQSPTDFNNNQFLSNKTAGAWL